MLKPSDFNNAVPQFTNGNYASNPINPQYVEEPSSTEYNHGAEPLQTLPAQWWNWFINKFTSRFNKLNIYVKNLFNELAQLLSLVNVTPDGTESSVTDGQLKNAFKELYPDYINTKLALESTYVKKTQKVNNHALTGDVTVTKSDVGLGSVANTGDSANAYSGGTTKFTTGGAYNLLSSIAPYFSTSTAYAIGALITYQNRLYECTTAHSAGAWNANHFTARSVQYVISNYILPSFAPAFSTSTSYAVGAFVTYQNKLYRCKATHSAGGWNTSHFELATLNDINTSLGTKADLLDLASAFSTSISYAVGDYVTYNGNLYRCTVAHSGAWNASHFTLVTVGGDLAEKTDITAFEEATDVTTHFDNAPYTSRVTDYDRASTDSIIGASFAVNQLVKNGNFANTSNWSATVATISASGNVLSVTATANNGYAQQYYPLNHNHKYLVQLDCKAQTNNTLICRMYFGSYSGTDQMYFNAVSTDWTTYAKVIQTASTGDIREFRLYTTTSGQTNQFRNVMIIDLTQMFGSAIADRIYAMEQATEGSGIAWIKSFGFFNKDYYATDEGSIQSVKPSACRTTGFNIARSWTNGDTYTQYGQALFIDCELRPNTTYCIGFKCPNYRCYFNENLFDYLLIQTNGQYQYFVMRTKDSISSQLYPQGYLVLKNASGNSAPPNFTQVCVSLADSRFNGQYEKYKGEWNYPLADTELRGIPKLDSNNNLYFDGDIYYPNGDVIRRYGVATISDFTSNHLSDNSTGGLGWIDTSDSVSSEIVNYLVNNFNLPTKNGGEGWTSTEPCIGVTDSSNGYRLRIYETHMTLAQFQAKYANLQAVYKKLTPTKETVAGFSNPHTLIRKGAEEFVDNRTIALPVGHETTYLSLPDWLSESDPFAIGIDSGIYTELAKKVDKTTTVNGHALSGNVTVTKGDVGLGNVSNTGDSATPVSGGTTKFTTGGAYDFFGGITNATTWVSRVLRWNMCKNWTPCTGFASLPSGYYISAMFHENNLWVASVKDDYSHCYIWWSDNGKSWNQGNGISIAVSSICYANNIWVAVGGGTAWSNDGKSWTESTALTGFTEVKYANNIWVAIGGNVPYWSVDGKSWTAGTKSNSSNVGYSNEHSLHYNNGCWIIFGRGIWQSSDGKYWTKKTSTSEYARGCYANGYWFAYCDSTIYKSLDGMNWYTKSSSVPNRRSFLYSNGIIINYGSTGDMLYSCDGEYWQSVTGNINTKCDRLYYYNGIWIGVGNLYDFIISYDGINWQIGNTHPSDFGNLHNGRYVYCSDSTWILCFNDNKVYWSSLDNAILE